MYLACNNIMKKDMVCLVCPKSCQLSVIKNSDEVAVKNNDCNRGVEFARKEIFNPERILTSTVRVVHGVLPLVSVRSDVPVQKAELVSLVKQLDGMVIPAPVSKGQVLVSALGQNKVNIIATRVIERFDSTIS